MKLRLSTILTQFCMYPFFKIPALYESFLIHFTAKYVSEMPLTEHNQDEKGFLETLCKRHRCFQNKHCEKAWWSKKL